MLNNLQFLRPWWFVFLIPLIISGILLFNRRLKNSAWQKVCDPKLLPYLIVAHSKRRYILPYFLLMSSGFSMVFALAGPSWHKIDVPTYQHIQPRIILLDMSDNMYDNDLSPDRLTRAKFKLHDLFKHQDSGQFALIAYTSEPFTVSPLTDDAQTIDTLVPALTENIMPIGGNDLSKALASAKDLFTANNTGFGDILVLSATIPDNNAINVAKKLTKQGVRTSILPIIADKNANSFFVPFAKAGNGQLLEYTFDSSDINTWLKDSKVQSSFKINELKNFPLMRDEGRYFVLLAIILLLPFFRRGYFARISG